MGCSASSDMHNDTSRDVSIVRRPEDVQLSIGDAEPAPDIVETRKVTFAEGLEQQRIGHPATHRQRHRSTCRATGETVSSKPSLYSA